MPNAPHSRSIAIPDHLWDALDVMSREMGVDRDGLVSQALFTFARLNGYLVPGDVTAKPGPSNTPTDPRAIGRPRPRTSAPLDELFEDDEPVTGQSPISLVPPEPARAAPRSRKDSGPALYLSNEDGELDPVVKDRFLIGRGKHCDLVINSGKVSREHAAILRESDGWYIEDLGSSNGTWFNKQQIKRRKIEDGDEYLVCSEKIVCVLR